MFGKGRQTEQRAAGTPVVRPHLFRMRTKKAVPHGRPCEEETKLDIIISNASSKPIYEQITLQLKDAILSGRLEAGSALPSIRSLANSLHVSVITTKRAYAELETQGFIDTVQGKGSFVTGGSLELLREERLRKIEASLAVALSDARAAGLDVADLHGMLDVLAACE